MKSCWHLVIATSFSMMVTLVFRCHFAGTEANDSLYQLHIADILHERILFLRACILYSESLEKCYQFTDDPSGIIVNCIPIFTCSWMLTVLFYGTRILKYTIPVLCAFLITWFIARYCDGDVMYYPVDTITVHLLVWQCVGLMSSWQIHELPWFSLSLHQGSTCVLLAFVAFYTYELLVQYLSVRSRLGFAWLLSIFDILGCLHPGSPMRAFVTSLHDNYSYEYAILPPGLYITHELEHDDPDDDQESLGLGDFIIYNWMFLFILPPFICIQEKTLVLIGHIITIQMGFWMTHSLGHYWQSNRLPAVPCSVVFVSLYALVVDHFYEIL